MPVGRLARVFPRRTKATPDDEYAFVGEPRLFMPPIDEVHISVAFTWDLPEAERLSRAWANVAPVKIGGPATGMRGEEFTAGRYIKQGYTITSRGCPNRCWFCSVWKRDGTIRELPIERGHIVNDDNLLACSTAHIFSVFKMLSDQPERSQFRGLEAQLFKPWHCEMLWVARPSAMWFAYDTPDDYEPLIEAGRLLHKTGFTENTMRAYVLIGGPKDTIAEAEKRLIDTCAAGFMPFAMLWADKDGRNKSMEWRRFQRLWCRPAYMRQFFKTAHAMAALSGVEDGLKEITVYACK